MKGITERKKEFYIKNNFNKILGFLRIVMFERHFSAQLKRRTTFQGLIVRLFV